MLVVLTETYCNKVNIQVTQRDSFIQNVDFFFIELNRLYTTQLTVVNVQLATSAEENIGVTF